MAQGAGQERLRVDKWLWHARMLKTRSLAARFVSDGYVRLNGRKLVSPATMVKPDDVLTLAFENTVKVCRILAVGTRRGPASEARALYEDVA